jgi:protein involved in polysaccharide export with SLBB domain
LLTTTPPLGISTFLATPVAVNRYGGGLGAGWLVAVLLVAAFASASAQRLVPPLEDPVLRPGDVLRLNVWRHPELSGDFVVAPDSTLVHPVYQVVKVAGTPWPVVRERLRAVLATYEQGVPFVLEPLFPVTVAGEVRQPNLYRLPRGTTFAQAIAQAGGPTELGRLNKVRVIRRDGSMVINLATEYSRYEAMPIASGDQVLVARRSNFNLLRDVLYPLTSATAAVAAVLAYSRNR